MIIDFFNTAAGLKSVSRQGWISKLGMENPESVADHSYMMSLMSATLSDLVGLDTLKVVKMSLLHDVAESRIGDLMHGEVSKSEKERMEDSAMDEILQDLPDGIRNDYKGIWREFQDSSTPESEFVHEVDKLEMALQAKIYSKNASDEKIRAFFESAQESIHNRHLQSILDEILSR